MENSLKKYGEEESNLEENYSEDQSIHYSENTQDNSSNNE